MISYKAVHFVGILSPEMASLAIYTAAHKVSVSGSDDHDDTLFAPALRRAGVTLFATFAQTNITKSIERVVVSPYYDDRHSEVAWAKNHKIKVMSATDYGKEISQPYRRLAIFDEYDGPIIAAGLTHLLQQGHQSVNALIHAVPQASDEVALASYQESDWFIAPISGFKRDASTYEAAFLSYTAEIVILPSVRYNYPELNTTLDDVYQTYYRFAKTIPRKGLIVGNSDWSRMKRLRTHLADRHFETYGFDNDAMWRIRDVEVRDGATTFSLIMNNQRYGPFTIPCTGETMIYNASAMAVTGSLLEMKPEIIQRGLATLPPLKRYLETRHDNEGRTIIDDQADHPDTIQLALQTIRERYPDKKIWCLYQPGSYLRTKAMAGELQEALSLADTVYIADIKGYPKEKSEGLHIRHFIAEMKQTHPQTYYLDTGMPMAELLRDRVALNDCIVTLGIEGICQMSVAPLLAGADEPEPGS